MLSSTMHVVTEQHCRDTDRFLLFQGHNLLVRGDQHVWQRSQLLEAGLTGFTCLLLERAPGGNVMAALMGQEAAARLHAEAVSTRSLLLRTNRRNFSLIGQGTQLTTWYCSHRFCGACGYRTQPHPEQRALLCPRCQACYYPRINPCVIVLVTDGPRVLLARSSRPGATFFSCLAGFMEVGETPEETVAREVREEVGIELKNIRYVRSQSWPFPSQLMLGFFADYDGGTIRPDAREIAEAAWFPVDGIPVETPPALSVAGQLIEIYHNMAVH